MFKQGHRVGRKGSKGERSPGRQKVGLYRKGWCLPYPVAKHPEICLRADLDGDQGAGKILGGERELVLSGRHDARGESRRNGADEGGSIADGFLVGFGILEILRDLVDGGFVEEGHHGAAVT